MKNIIFLFSVLCAFSVAGISQVTINPIGPFCQDDGQILITASPGGGVFSGPGIIDTTFGFFEPWFANLGSNTITYTTTGFQQLGDSIAGFSEIFTNNRFERFGNYVLMSDNGKRVVALAPFSWAGGVNWTGAIRSYEWDGSTWAKVGDDITGNWAGLGFSPQAISQQAMAISATGNRLCFRSYWHVGGSSIPYIQAYEWDGTSWDKMGDSIHHRIGGVFDAYIGESLGLSNDGTRLITRTGIPPYNGMLTYDWNGSSWDLVDTVFCDGVYDEYGTSLSVSGDGTRMVVGAKDTDILDGAGFLINEVGLAIAYEWDGNNWNKLGNNIPSDSIHEGHFGSSVRMTDDGNTIAIAYEGLGYDPNNNKSVGGVKIYDWDSQATDWVLSSIIERPDSSYKAQVEVAIGGGPNSDYVLLGYGGYGAWDVLGYQGKTIVYKNISGIWTEIATLIGLYPGSNCGGINAIHIASDTPMVVLGLDAEPAPLPGAGRIAMFSVQEPGSDSTIVIINETPLHPSVTVINSTYPNGAQASGYNLATTTSGAVTTWTSTVDVGFGLSGTGDIPNFIATNPTGSPITTTVSYESNTAFCARYGPDFHITVEDGPLSIDQEVLSQSLHIYPNPTQDKITLAFDLNRPEEVEICVYDIQGFEVFTDRYAGRDQENQINLNLQELSKGLYQVALRGEAFIVTKKLLITN